MRHRFVVLAFVAAFALSAAAPSTAVAQDMDMVFNRIASIPVYLNTDIESETVAEIISVTPDGNTLVYTDAETGSIGFIDITDPAAPAALGALELGGEPTSVAVHGELAYAAINTSETFTEPSGALIVINVAEQAVVSEFDLGGQPDSVAVSSDGAYVAIVIENERDEDLGEGEPPQLPGGALVIFSTADESLNTVDLTDVADLFPEDAEPEYVDINSQNIAIVTLQENNYIALVDLATGDVVNGFSAGTEDLDQIDITEEGLITLTDSLSEVPREPDAANWITDDLFATADEGDLFGGSRGFTIFNTDGEVVFAPGNSVEHIAARHGHYPEERSGNKGSEPEGVEFGSYESGDYLFVGLERSSLVLVYNVNDPAAPEYIQALPTGLGPEGLLAIPSRDLFVVASEVDEPGGVRSVATIYQLEEGPADYPTLASADREDGTPITWGAISGLAADPMDANTVYAIRDSFYTSSSIYVVDASAMPAVITDEIFLMDSNGVLAEIAPDQVNEDGTVNLDQEGITVRAGGGFWVASEGAGTVGDEDRPVTTLNLLVGVAEDGTIEEVVTLPDAVNEIQVRFGFEGVASTGEAGSEVLYVVIQRQWTGDMDGMVRVGRYDVAAGEWAFYYYELDTPESAGWVGLSEITAIDDETFYIVERDNQADVTAAIKRVYQVSVAGVEPLAEGEFPVLEKTMVHDLMPDLASTNGQIIEKVEGFAILADGRAVFATDNDGVDDSSGETQFMFIDMMMGE